MTEADCQIPDIFPLCVIVAPIKLEEEYSRYLF